MNSIEKASLLSNALSLIYLSIDVFLQIANCLKVDVGNATKLSDITAPIQVNPNFQGEKLEEIPIQVQITYSCLDGTRLLRVLTTKQKTTSDRTKMEEVGFSSYSLSNFSKAAIAIDMGRTSERIEQFLCEKH